MLIQWYPGHMAKAKKMLAENLKLIDVVIELVDARAPRATRNPDFDALFSQKQRIILLNKSDLASEVETKKWVAYYKTMGICAMPFVSTNAAKRKAAIDLIEKTVSEKVDRLKERGIHKTVRAMVVGIPNVGKSTFINRIAGESRAQVGDKPGVTKSKQWVKVTPYLELMDTPGLLWPKLEEETLARHLAYIGSVKDDIMDTEQLAAYLLSDLNSLCHEQLAARYSKIQPDTDINDMLECVCRSRGFVLHGNTADIERAARIVLDEYRAGKIARVTLDRVGN